jgi:hypothetical protein
MAPPTGIPSLSSTKYVLLPNCDILRRLRTLRKKGCHKIAAALSVAVGTVQRIREGMVIPIVREGLLHQQSLERRCLDLPDFLL